MNLVRAELFKIRTTRLWWILLLVLVPLWALAVAVGGVQAYVLTQDDAVDASAPEQVRVAAEAVNLASNLYTAGQWAGLLCVLLLSATMVTGEFFHRTATTTFLTTPRRERVVLGKVAAAAVVALAGWALLTLLNLGVAPLVLRGLDLPVLVGDAAVWRAIGLNGLAFALWAVLGVGAGVLIRNQVAAMVTLSAVYVVGTQTVAGILGLLSQVLENDLWSELAVAVPTVASSLLVSGTELPGNPPRWVGLVVLVAYAAVTGVVGTLITRDRDVS